MTFTHSYQKKKKCTLLLPLSSTIEAINDETSAPTKMRVSTNLTVSTNSMPRVTSIETLHNEWRMVFLTTVSPLPHFVSGVMTMTAAMPRAKRSMKKVLPEKILDHILHEQVVFPCKFMWSVAR